MIVGRVVLEIIIPAKEVLSKLVSQQEVRGENHRACQKNKYEKKLGEVSGSREDLLLQRLIAAHKLSSYESQNHMSKRL